MPTILAIETSSHVGAVCVLRDGVAFNEIVRDEAKLSAWALPAIDRAMKHANVGFDAIDAIAFGCGPGAFTGVRTACATAQAIAYARKKPLYAVNSMQALALPSLSAPKTEAQFSWAMKGISVILDARMNELFLQDFSLRKSTELEPVSDAVVATIASTRFDSDMFALGSGAVLLGELQKLDRERIDAIRALTEQAENAWAESVAHISLQRFENGDAGIDPLDAKPTYVRNKVARTEAERAADAAQKVLA